MRGVLNATTNVVHKQESRFDTECEATNFVPDDRLEITSIEAMRWKPEVRRCGRCFEDGGGY